MPDNAAVALIRYEMYIDGGWTPAVSGKTFETNSPFTGEPWALIPDAAHADVEAAVGAARKAFDAGPWGRSTARDRSFVLRRIAELIGENAERLAAIESRDNGKLLREMLAQWRYMPEWFNFFAGAADKIEGRTLQSDKPNFAIMTRREPIGVAAAITPWNSPCLLMSWKLAPALAAGCTFVLKPSEHASASALEFAKLVERAGLPEGVFNVVTGGPEVGQALVNDKRVDKIAFTGSNAVGRQIGRQAAENLVGVLLELGGKSPNVVFADCNMDAAVNGVISGIFAASGQSCMAGSRLVIERSIASSFVGTLRERANRIKLGDPSEPTTEMGPVATAAQHARIVAMIREALDDGAKLICGGIEENLGGLFVPPTILTDVKPSMKIVREEVFGPVLVVQEFDGEDEAISLANDTDFGLAAGVWTSNVHRAHRLSQRIRAGTVWINAYRSIAYNAPFGGFKQSGLGRENGVEAIDEYLGTKTIWVELSGESRDPFTIG